MLLRPVALALALLLGASVVACAGTESPPPDEGTERGAISPTPEETSSPADGAGSGTSTAAKTDEAAAPADKPATTTTQAKGGAGTPAAPEGRDPLAAAKELQACVSGCGQDLECAKACFAGLLPAGQLPELPGAGGD